jgi:trehalose-6-phosphatase
LSWLTTCVFDCPPEFASILTKVEEWLDARESANVSIVRNSDGFAVKFTDKNGRPARGVDVDAVVVLVRNFVKERADLMVVVTDGFANVCPSVLTKVCALQKIAVPPPFMGRLIVVAGDGQTDEAMLELAEIGINAGREPIMAGDRVSSHTRLIHVLAWLTAWRQDAEP